MKKIRNPFYERVRRDGIHIQIERPALKDRRPKRIKKDGGVNILPRGNTRRDAAEKSDMPKSIRLSPSVWTRVDAQAKREGITRHAAMKQAILIWLQS